MFVVCYRPKSPAMGYVAYGPFEDMQAVNKWIEKQEPRKRERMDIIDLKRPG